MGVDADKQLGVVVTGSYHSHDISVEGEYSIVFFKVRIIGLDHIGEGDSFEIFGCGELVVSVGGIDVHGSFVSLYFISAGQHIGDGLQFLIQREAGLPCMSIYIGQCFHVFRVFVIGSF